MAIAEFKVNLGYRKYSLTRKRKKKRGGKKKEKEKKEEKITNVSEGLPSSDKLEKDFQPCTLQKPFKGPRVVHILKPNTLKTKGR